MAWYAQCNWFSSWRKYIWSSWGTLFISYSKFLFGRIPDLSSTFFRQWKKYGRIKIHRTVPKQSILFQESGIKGLDLNFIIMVQYWGLQWTLVSHCHLHFNACLWIDFLHISVHPSGRVFLQQGGWTWRYNNEFCKSQSKDTLECYLLPFSKCTLQDAVNAMKYDSYSKQFKRPAYVDKPIVLKVGELMCFVAWIVYIVVWLELIHNNCLVGVVIFKFVVVFISAPSFAHI